MSRPTRHRVPSPAAARAVALAAAAMLAACGSDTATSTTSSADDRADVVVTSAVLGAVVREVVGGAADVTVLMPNGIDPHEWEPSAKDIAAVAAADLVVENGLDLEAGLQDALGDARDAGVALFTASDHVDVRTVGEGEGVDPDDPDQAAGAPDPHLWTDPAGMADVAAALATALAAIGVDVGDRATSVPAELRALDARVADILSVVPDADRKLVTGHESLGYFARRYGFTLVGAVIPSISSEAEASAGDLADLADLIEANHVPAIFTELGTTGDVVDAVAEDTGVRVVELATHALPDDGSYSTFMTDLAQEVAGALAPAP